MNFNLAQSPTWGQGTEDHFLSSSNINWSIHKVEREPEKQISSIIDEICF